MKALVTGSAGFIGRHMVLALKGEGFEVVGFTEDDPAYSLASKATGVDVVIHLAGVNRPPTPDDYDQGNRGTTEDLCAALEAMGNKCPVLFSSSTQADLDNPYGASKLGAEKALTLLSQKNGNPVVIFRLTNVFGKWSLPNYNSAVATFCYNVAHGLPLQVNDPDRIMQLIYIDDVVSAFMGAVRDRMHLKGISRREAGPVHEASLGWIADTVRSFSEIRGKLMLPNLADPLVRKLHATYVSNLVGSMREHELEQKTDNRGSLAEFIKSPHFGQVFVSRTHPGITRGNHWHHTKNEKFLVVEGEAVIQLRPVDGGEVQEHRVKGTDYKVIDITPGWTHNITNVGSGELVTLFWANEMFDPEHPDTTFEAV